MAATSVTRHNVEYTPVLAFDDKQQIQEQDRTEHVRKVSQNSSEEFVIITIPGQVVNYDAFFVAPAPKLTRTERMNTSQCHIGYEYDRTHPDKTLIETDEIHGTDSAYYATSEAYGEILRIKNIRMRHLPKGKSIIYHQ